MSHLTYLLFAYSYENDGNFDILMSHLLTGTKFSDFATFVFSVPWFRGSAMNCDISFHSVKH